MQAAELVRRGLAMHQRNNFVEAERLYRLALEQDRHHPDGLHLLGLVLLERGKAGQAIELIGRAVKRAPRSSPMRSNLGNAFRASGRLSDALSCYRAAVQLDPNNGPAHHNLGQLLRDQGNLSDAVDCFRTAARLDPTNLRIAQALAETTIQARDFPRAEAVLCSQLARSPNWATGYSLRGAVQALLGNYDTALDWLDQAIALAPGEASHLAAKGAWLLRARRVEAAAAAFRLALELDNAQAQTWNDLGRALRAQGELEEARLAFSRAIDLDPAHVDARRNLALVGDLHAAEHLDVLLHALDGGRLSIEERVVSEFAVGKLLDDANRYAEAFRHYAAANDLVLSSRGIDHSEASALPRKRRLALLEDKKAAPERGGLVDTKPVFVVGLPRSGTSLVEQIVASHSRAYGAGELAAIGELARRRTQGNDPAALARDYIARLAEIAPGADRVVDKMPANIYHLDFISDVFDKPRVIFCGRHPLDNILSCYFQFFTSGNDFSYDLVACASRWLEAEEIAKAWLGRPQLNAIEISYEALVEDLEGQSRRLIDFLQLDWEPACLRFHETKRVVATASGWQVRQPLYASSVGRWRSYEAELRDGLGAELFATLLQRHEAAADRSV